MGDGRVQGDCMVDERAQAAPLVRYLMMIASGKAQMLLASIDSAGYGLINDLTEIFGRAYASNFLYRY